jgi:hypothetical protein
MTMTKRRTSRTSHLAAVLETESGVAPGYAHHRKMTTPGEPLELPGALLKWYDLYPEDRPIPDELRDLARAHLLREPREARGLGHAILHRCGEDFYFLLLSTWRGNNELWETVLYKEGTMDDFALFPREREHKGTFCVWEQVPVWHEQGAWVRFLESARDEAAAEAWLADRYEGPA